MNDKVYSHEEFAYKWEEREHQIREDIISMRRRQDEQIALQTKQIGTFNRTIHEQQRIILRIREIPLIGKYIVRWAEQDYLG